MLAQKIFGPRKNFGPKKMLVQKIVVQKDVASNFFLPNGDQLKRQRSCQKLGVEGLSNNVLWLSKKMFQPY